ncbi:MAG TPA: hypothetical protein VLX59_18950 [Acidimicrobiales bacterium]|nr:hypothetical protein [Acidimicrobiales bacterium]
MGRLLFQVAFWLEPIREAPWNRRMPLVTLIGAMRPSRLSRQAPFPTPVEGCLLV